MEIGSYWKFAARNSARRFGLEVTPTGRWRPPPGLDAHLARLLPTRGVNCMIDVGANRGQFAKRMRRNGYRGQIISFEPIPEVFDELRWRARKDSAWRPVWLALGSLREMRSISVSSTTELSSFLPSNPYQQSLLGELSTQVRRETVQVDRLDNVLPSLIPINNEWRCFLKLDTQGWDLEVLRGAVGIIDYIEVIQTEMSVRPIYEGMPTYQEVTEYVTSMGFRLSGMFPVTLAQDGTLVEFDGVFVKTVD